MIPKPPGSIPREDRIIELGGVELVNRFPTGRSFHHYLNPQGRSPCRRAGRSRHQPPTSSPASRPSQAIAEEFLAFIDGAKLVAHNAGFDIGFLNAEFARLGQPPVAQAASSIRWRSPRRKHPMGPNSLDALCRRYGIDNSHRTKHGALLDSELLAEVYIELIGGKQAALGLEIIMPASGAAAAWRCGDHRAASRAPGRCRRGFESGACRACRDGRRTWRSRDLERLAPAGPYGGLS